MVPTGLAMRNTFADTGLADCVSLDGADSSSRRRCNAAFHQFTNRVRHR